MTTRPSRTARFEREGEERFARGLGGAEWRQSLERLFAEAARDPDSTSGTIPAPAETVALWCDLVKSMGPSSHQYPTTATDTGA